LKITEEKVRYVADLANLKLTGEEIARMQKEMDAILTHIDKLNELDTSSVPPMTQVLFQAEETATLRQDVEGSTLAVEAVANAPVSGGGFFKVPRVIEK
jgi:aspartyl-tRNA(Asn)/glutamyl-tRNA(Gln) amidotransferase subunit C